MTTGDDMEIAVKNKRSENVTWTAPVVMASNHTPGYVNTGDNVGRRLVMIRFDRVVHEPPTDLLPRILAAAGLGARPGVSCTITIYVKVVSNSTPKATPVAMNGVSLSSPERVFFDISTCIHDLQEAWMNRPRKRLAMNPSSCVPQP